uniref:Calmodulin regulated spectrin associated protein family member 3 n=1 Tax=Hucho hucho TaxID=62062 RepID=A0A4W5RCN7_9TELE
MVDSNAMRKTFVVPDIKPLDLYDCTRAKICASVGWVLAKSYGNAEHVPVELREPFYCDQYEQEHLKPPVTRLLLSSELYCRTYGLLQGGQGGSGAPKDNATLLQLLANRGVTPKDQDVPVTDADLRHKPIKMVRDGCGIWRVDMVILVPRAKSRVILILYYLIYWRICYVRSAQEDSEQSDQGGIRYRKDKMLSKQKPTFPVVTEVKDLSTGCAIAAVVHYYCPGLLQLEDVCMKESMAVEDSLYNLQLIREFCDSCLKSCCPLVLEDLLYSPQELQVNMMSFLAELLGWFEVRRPEFVHVSDSVCLHVSCRESWENMDQEAFQVGPISLSLYVILSLALSLSVSSIFQLYLNTKVGVNSISIKSFQEVNSLSSHLSPYSRPLSSAVSFSIPFGLDSDVDVVMGGAITRSVSSDNVAPGQTITRPPAPPEVEGDGELPTIEEALQIIHNEDKMEPRLHPDGAADGFFLHSPDDPASARRNGRATHPSHPVDSDASEDLLLLPNAQSTPSTPAVHTRGSTAPMTSWMSELGARLDEKRKAIEAQKKRIEAIFAKHRQRLGKSAFLQLKKEQGVGEREEEEEGVPGGEQAGVVSRQPAPLGDYNNAVSKLNAALSSLQSDMQRLSEQQNQLIRKKPAAPTGNKSWVIPPSLKSSAPARTSKSPQVQRRAQSVPPKSPKHQATHYHHARPQDLKVPGLSRVLTPPQNVDTIPHLRRASPWQCRDQNSSTFNISSAPSPSSAPTPIPTPTPTPRALSLALDDNMSDAGSNEDQILCPYEKREKENRNEELSLCKLRAECPLPVRILKDAKTCKIGIWPKLYKEPSFKSNKFIIHNAISRCCLAGKVNEPQKNKIVEEMEKCQANHFLILFRDSSCQFRAVYTMNPETEEMVRLTGIGPRVISPAMVESIYKYSSDRKQFTTIPSKTMSMSVDAFTIPGHLWQSKRPGTPKKLGTPK